MVFVDGGVRHCVPGGGGHPARADAKLGVLLTRLAWTSVGPTQPPLSDRCSQFAHRRCAYSWTSQHTSVASMQVRRTTVDAPVSRGTGWPGSNLGIPTTTEPQRPGGFLIFESGSRRRALQRAPPLLVRGGDPLGRRLVVLRQRVGVGLEGEGRVGVAEATLTTLTGCRSGARWSRRCAGGRGAGSAAAQPPSSPPGIRSTAGSARSASRPPL
jgi:hypothetical protein